MTKRRKQDPLVTNRLTRIVCENIRRLREKEGETLAVFSKRTKFSASYISTMEHLNRNPTIENLDRISRAYGVDPRKMLVKGGV